ncbi:MAG: hypothetical protein HFE51_04955 [Clostridia bacterium]|nr:hypothetical protein [Clostridia bacterium]
MYKERKYDKQEFDEMGEEMEEKLKELTQIIAEGKEIITKANERLDKIEQNILSEQKIEGKEQKTENKESFGFNLSWLMLILMLFVMPRSADDVSPEEKTRFMDLAQHIIADGKKVLRFKKNEDWKNSAYKVTDINNIQFAAVSLVEGSVSIYVNYKCIFSEKIGNSDRNVFTDEEKIHYGIVAKKEIEKYYNNEVYVIGTLE